MKDKNQLEWEITAFIATREGFEVKDITEKFNIAESEAFAILQKMVDDGVIDYRWKPKPSAIWKTGNR
jgi:DNA-binding MarR family transcriptional regulator